MIVEPHPERRLLLAPSAKYGPLIDAYRQMARQGRRRADGSAAPRYARQEAVKFRAELKPLFASHSVRSVLDYGAGGGDWRRVTTPEGATLAAHLDVDDYRAFEPARDIDQRGPADAVVCFDVLEHVFRADIAYVLADIFACARRLVVLNVACYPAEARLPNGENAHSTQRPPHWWAGAVDMIAAAHPGVAVALYCSETYAKVRRAPVFAMSEVAAGDGFAR